MTKKGNGQSEMKTRDRRKIEKVDKYDLNAFRARMPQEEKILSDYSDQTEGVVRIARDSQKESEEEFHTMQEQHNANHALYYFNMLADGLIEGRSTGNNCQKMVRAREHMMNLREFIGDEKAELKGVIETLLKKIQEFCPIRRKQFGLFLVENWPLMRSFSQAYVKKEQRCLTDEQFGKLNDVLSGRCLLKLWWWKRRTRRRWMKTLGLIKKVAK